MQNVFRSKRQCIAWTMLIVLGTNLFSPIATYALTSGPKQPELQAFQPAGTSDMVDIFSGDFSYNIPLFELPGPNGGYPFNLSYQSGITMDQESSWVGLGWSLNPGAINRQMRGLPDDFNGDKIKTTMSIDPSFTTGVGAGGSVEIFGGAKEIGNLGVSLFYNNYKGFGYSIDASSGFGKSIRNGMTAGVGLHLSLNSQEGTTVSPSLNLGTLIGDFGLTTSYNRSSGLNNVSVFADRDVSFKGKSGPPGDKSVTNKTSQPVNASSSLNISLVAPGYTPQISMPMSNASVSAKFNSGGSLWGIFNKAYLTGFFTKQYLRHDKRPLESKAFGYLNYDEGSKDAAAVLDLNREKDGPVSKENPNLGIPSMTYDIYSVTGQGIGAMYRPIRNDIGILRDAEVVSESNGGSLGIDAAPGAAHAGINLSINHSRSTSGGWTEDNDIVKRTGFETQASDDAFEPWNFKVHGELTGEKMSILDTLGGVVPMRIKLSGKANPKATNVLEGKTGNYPLPDMMSRDRSRKQRNEMIQTYTNQQVMNGNAARGQEIISFFRNSYRNAAGTEVPFERDLLLDDENKKKHIAGFSALTSDGLRYNYTIPVYNNKQEELIFSTSNAVIGGQYGNTVNVDTGISGDPAYGYEGTEKFFKKVEIPPYAHAYLLTSIVGPDYVDVDDNGVSEQDLGYWVKFTYQKTTTSVDQYKWRDPYYGAHFLEGWKSEPRDNKATFTYGEKDLWFLVRAETKSHIATFDILDRKDGKGVVSKLNNTLSQSYKSVKQLRKISLYSRVGYAQNYAIKTVNFRYDYSLCPLTPNSPTETCPLPPPDDACNTIGGKLTLKKLWFEYGSSNRGQLNRYEFTYDELRNVFYDLSKYDRWGGYKVYPDTDVTYNTYFPYAEQDSSQQENLNKFSSAWSLTQIKTPSGSTIMVDYESDDYGYVQHKRAMQMTEIVNPYVSAVDAEPEDEDDPINNFDLSTPIIRFKLEHPINAPMSSNPSEEPGLMQNVVRDYLDLERGQVFFKVLMNLRTSSEDNLQEYISGYADINTNPEYMKLEVGPSGDYEYGSFRLNPDQGTSTHPFTMRVWQHLRTNQPDLTKPASINQSQNLLDQLRSIASPLLFENLRAMFQNFNNACATKGWGKKMVASRSVIRLNSPDKIKYGGGSRVKQITVKDNWLKDDEGIYGQVYDYTMTEDGRTISSGVAAYEPLIGGEENSLRYAKKWSQSIALRSDNAMFFEYPVNESYYPAPHVGYRKVTVLSLAAAAMAGMAVNNATLPGGYNLFPYGTDPNYGPINYGTTGKTVHEFYTAKEFPVIADETEKDDIPFNLPIPIPFLGHMSISKLAATQGYSIITNDMHGKLRQLSSFRQLADGSWENDPISYVRYNYLCDSVIYQREKVLALKSEFVLNDDETTISPPNLTDNIDGEMYTMGQENEFFMDMRQYDDNTWEGGVNLNLDLVFVPLLVPITIPVPTIWPSIGTSTSQLRTAVTNKIIFRPGILEGIEAYDGGSMVKTENRKWDRLTGQVVLTTVNNNFDSLVYNYTIPAYTQYEGVGGAYQNAGLKLSVRSVLPTSTAGEYFFSSNLNNSQLFPGDEIILYSDEGMTVPVTKVIFMGENGVLKRISSPVTIPITNPPTSYTGLIVRSGYRNQLNAAAGTITALKDPSVPGLEVIRTKTILVPANP